MIGSKTGSQHNITVSDNSGVVYRESKIEDLDSMVMYKKSVDVQRPSEVGASDSGIHSPVKLSFKKMSLDSNPAGLLLSDHHYETAHLLSSSPILEEEYSDSCDHS